MAIRAHAFTRSSASSGSGQGNPLIDALMRQAMAPQQIRHPMQGLAQMSQAALATYLQRKDKDEGKERRAGMARTYSDAMYAGQARPAESKGGIDWNAKLANPGMMARILTGNPDTAEFGMQMGWDEMQVQREQAHELAVKKTERGYEESKAANERRWAAEKWELQRQKTQADRLEMAEAKGGLEGGKRPAMLQVADAYKQAMKRAGKDVTDARALRWAKSSVDDTPQDTWTKIYLANRRDVAVDEDEARQIADEVMSYVHGEGFGQPTPAQPERQIDLNPVGAAKAASPPGRPRTEVIVPIPPETGAPAPRRKPAREIDGPTQPIPRDATGKVDAQRLNRGQVYEAADGTRWSWNGQNFTEAQ